jgi:hypothetical protein
MAKTGFEIPSELEARLRRFVPWGKKGKLIEGLLRLAVEDEELRRRALKAYYNAHK